MRLILSLFIFLFYYIPYSQEIIRDSTQIDGYKNIDFQKELRKFKDSVSDKIYPVILSKEYSKLNNELIIDNTDNIDILYKLSKS